MTCGSVCGCGLEINFVTLGSCAADGFLSCTGSGTFYIRFSWVASARSELQTGSPSANAGIVLLGFCVRMCRMSEDSCTRKLVKLKVGNSMLCEKNSTVSHDRVSLSREK